MKVGISRFVVVAAIAALVGMAGVTPLFAQISLTNFSPTPNPNLTLNGSALQIGTNGAVLRLTPEQVCSDGCLANTHVSGSAWFHTQQPITGGFSTTFKFQITHDANVGAGPADGLAFVIQNSDAGTAARGGAGGAIGYGLPDGGPDTTDGGIPIPKSLAVEFDTYQNPWDQDANHVAIQSCGVAANSQVHFDGESTDPCNLGLAGTAQLGTSLTSGTHTVTVSYVPPSCTDCNGTLHVILDNKDLFNGGVSVPELGTFLGLANGTNAWVGFTGSTGGLVENNDILSWTFTPQAQSAPVTTTTPAVLPFNGGTNNHAYDYNAVLTGGGTGAVTSATVTIKPILISEEACEKLVDANPKFGKAQCFVYQNAGKDSSGNSVDSAVLFELTCPDQPGGTCGDTGPANFFADLGSNFTFTKAENPGFQLLNSTIGPYPGWLKGSGTDPLHPCTPNSDGVTPLFQSNQITSFSVVGDPLGTTKGKSGGGGSCWVATFFTAGEAPPGVKITNPTFANYTKGSVVTASYTCSNPKTTKPTSNPTGPYLTVASCTQSQTPNTSNQTQVAGCVPGNVCTGGVDTATKGLHVFTVTSKDSGGNVGANVVIYNVK